MKKTILVIASDDTKYALLNKQLTELHYPDNNIYRALSVGESLSFENKGRDIILAAFPDLNTGNLLALETLCSHFFHVPVIVLSGSDEAQLSAINVGAQDVLIFDHYDTTQLAQAISFAIERKASGLKAEHTYYDYRSHFDNGPLPMWVVDSKTMKFLLINSAAVEKYGYTREELMNMTLRDVRPEEDMARFLVSYNSHGSGNFDAGYWRHLKKNGEIFHVHVYSHPTVFNNMEARLCFLVDVNEKILTDRKNAELAELIKEQKEQLDSVLTSVSDAIWSRRADTMELIYANDAYYKLFGYVPHEVKTDKEHVINAVYPDDKLLFLKAMADVKIMGKVELIYRYFHRDGSLRALKVKAELKKGVNGQPDIVNGITNDITQEKKMFDAIRNSEQKLRATINNTRDLIWSVNTNLEILFCNEPYQDFVYGQTGIMPQEGDYVLADSDSESFIAKRTKEYNLALSGESITTITEEQYKGETLYLEISSSPIINQEGRIAGVNCIARDISEQRKQLMMIQQQNEKLKEIAWIQSNKMRGQVASILGLIPLFDYEHAHNKYNAGILEKLQSVTKELDAVLKEIAGSVSVDKN